MTMYQTHPSSSTLVSFSDENPDGMPQRMVHASPKTFLEGYDQPIPRATESENSVSFGLARTLSRCQTETRETAGFVNP
jgi:hypothetical protein